MKTSLITMGLLTIAMLGTVFYCACSESKSIDNHDPVVDTVLAEDSEWRYTFGERDGWNEIGFDCKYWSVGDSSFGNPEGERHGFAYNTEWPEWSTLYARNHFTASPGQYGQVQARVAIDNGFVLYVNEVEIDSVYRDGYARKWQYTITIPDSVLRSDSNLVSVKGIDHGTGTGFDLMIIGQD